MSIRHSLIVITLFALCASVGLAAENTKCPMTGNDVKPNITMDMHGSKIAFCCGGCRANFQKLSHSEQHAKLDAMAKESAEDKKPAEGEQASFMEELILSRAYILPNCPVTNKPVNSMKEAVTKVIDDREITFCCAPCIKKFEADLPKYNAKVNEQIIKQQLPAYPLQNCLASGRPIDVKGTPTNSVYGNQLMRFCCGGCAAYVQEDPVRLKKAMATLDAAYTAQQLATYPLSTCVVSGEPLGDKAVNVVIGSHLVRLCCAQCEKKFNRNPRPYMAKLNAADDKAEKTGS
ncbi:MAG: hypothetical protein VX527_00995 [Planctomycetota bacterium]|nr:hypothetical protein [Planctomycetota bacterium]